MHEILIRPILAGDYDAWLPLWNGYNAFYGRVGPTALSPEVTRTTWARFFSPDEPVHALVAESNGELLGLAHYLYHRSCLSARRPLGVYARNSRNSRLQPSILLQTSVL